ncbi:substrate-binding domain-containing protein [Candidatus Reidiella endopervernicosa]|uniref:Substrate-binding domain-containing protein n=1 Tax=Candidatus Reidiella endopervernicosa TaxID=2738883 RepID=A0A6N0HZH3_9GAMM|nr:substrate-binding domain-containing protein [Candidatus Reidiella endopervernicosa]QKQ27744.1 substrate-binding domain-containing protein [Candidatus Reidiella endopervernicosa]
MEWRTNIVLFVMVLFSLASSAVVAKAGSREFSDHLHVEKMPVGWEQQPIQYKKMPKDIDLAITLDQHLYPALTPLIERYAKSHALRIAVADGTCGISAGSLLDKRVDIGGFCCPAGEIDRLPGLTYHTLGIAAVALIVHTDNPVADVTLKQARDIYSGSIGSWSNIKPSFNQPIKTIARLHCKNRPGHWRLILDNEDMFSPVTREISTIADMVEITSRQINALGYESLWMASLYGGKRGVKALMIDGVKPSDDAALIGHRYPFYRSYNITTWSAKHLRSAHAEKLVDYIYQNFDQVDAKYGIVAADRLRDAGWQFSGDELIGSPVGR